MKHTLLTLAIGATLSASAGAALAATAPLQFELRPYSFSSPVQAGAARGQVLASHRVEAKDAPWLRLIFKDVTLAPGSLLRITSVADGAQQTLNATTLRQGQVISIEESERRLKSAAGEQAAVRAAEAMVTTAKLDLEFTQIKAPISGRVSDARVTEGNLITGGTSDPTLLTTIVALDPIYVDFEVDERSALKYREMHKTGERESALFQRIPAEMALVNQEGWPHRGEIDFVDNQINPETGTIRARGIFPNKDRLMSPGFFAKVRIPGSGEYDGLLIRDAAVGDDQGSSYVWVIDAEDKAVYRPIKLGPLLDGLRVVREGLKADERVVILGLMSVRNGSKVKPALAEMALEPAKEPKP